MIIDFTNVNGGGGGSGYTLPAATQSTLGGVIVGSGLSITSAGTLSADAQPVGIATTASTGVVKIGEGINVDSAGTISVTGGTGGGIEVVTELPASGTDGQVVLLIENVPEKIIELTNDSNTNFSGVCVGVTQKTLLYNYEYYGLKVYVYVNANNSITVYHDKNDEETNLPVGTENYDYDMTYNNRNKHVIFTVTESGFTATSNNSSTIQNQITNINQPAEEKEVLYTWSDNAVLTLDIDYTASDTGYWCLRYKYSELPNETLMVSKYTYGENYYHFVHNSGELRMYESASADTYTATTYQVIAKYGFEYKGRNYIYWTDDELVFTTEALSQRISFNIDGFYRNGWHKNMEHKRSSKAFYKDYVWYDEDYGIISKHNSYPMYDVDFKINPTGQYATGNRLYSKNNSNFPTIFAPTTTGTTGQVCIAGNGWAAPTWANPETLTNGVKFWKGTQDEYDEIGEGNYDASTLYIIIPD